jgi:hypothetical protein
MKDEEYVRWMFMLGEDIIEAKNKYGCIEIGKKDFVC